MTEDALHAAVAQLLDVALLPPVVWTAFPAGGGGAARGGRLKHLGLKAGFPDIFLIHHGHTFGIELKTAKGRLLPSQKIMHPILEGAGMRIAVCRSVDDVLAALRGWGLPLRGMT